ncbi:hypothetical protein ACVMAJ_002254 [Bradyrhizobium sp. USDA 4448]
MAPQPNHADPIVVSASGSSGAGARLCQQPLLSHSGPHVGDMRWLIGGPHVRFRVANSWRMWSSTGR